jgi:hypothetical protein
MGKMHDNYFQNRKVKSALLIGLILCLCLSACGDDGNISEKSKIEYVQSGGSIIASSQCGEVTLSLKNVFGDDHSQFALLEITLPEEAVSSVPQYKADEITVQPIKYYSANISYDDIAGMTYNEADDYISENENDVTFSVASGCESISNKKSNVIQLYVWCIHNGESIAGVPLTMLIGSLGYYDTSNYYQTLYEGPFVISWTPKTDSSILTYELAGNNGLQGKIKLSPYFMHADISSTGYENLNTISDTITFGFNDGSTITLSQLSKGGSVGVSGNSYACLWNFENILNLSRLSTITIGNDEISADAMQTD